MKIIKSLFLITVGICTTTLLHAQEVKTLVVNKTEVKMPPQVTPTNAPSPMPEFKAQPQVAAVAKEAPAVAAETPSPLKKDRDSKPTQNMSAEQAKILAGKADNIKPAGPASPNTIYKDPKLLPAGKSTAVKQDQ